MSENLNLAANYRVMSVKALNKHKFKRTTVSASKELGVSVRTLQRWMKEFNINWCNQNQKYE